MCEDEFDFEKALKYALECTGNHGMSPKPEQVTAIGAVYDKKAVFSSVSACPTHFMQTCCGSPSSIATDTSSSSLCLVLHCWCSRLLPASEIHDIRSRDTPIALRKFIQDVNSTPSSIKKHVLFIEKLVHTRAVDTRLSSQHPRNRATPMESLGTRLHCTYWFLVFHDSHCSFYTGW